MSVGRGREAVSNTMAAGYASCDLVFGTGKVAIEAIACGRPVVCVDERGAAGLVTSDLFSNWRARNFGSSLLRRAVKGAFIANEMRLFDPEDFIRLPAKYRAELLLDTYMDRFEEIYSEALEIRATGSGQVSSIALGSYIEKILPLGRGPGTMASPSDLIVAQSNSARFRAEVEQLRLETFTFAKETALTFADGDAGRGDASRGVETRHPLKPLERRPARAPRGAGRHKLADSFNHQD